MSEMASLSWYSCQQLRFENEIHFHKIYALFAHSEPKYKKNVWLHLNLKKQVQNGTFQNCDWGLYDSGYFGATFLYIRLYPKLTIMLK